MASIPIIPVILAGGSGTRLWPLSREHFPKQLIRLNGDTTMLQETVLRLSGLDGVTAPIVIANESNRFMVSEQLRCVDIRPQSVTLEPFGRNTAPAVAVAALQALAVHPAAAILVLPSDHHIADPETFRRAISRARVFVAQGSHVTFGIVPTAPETGYGYIKRGTALDGGDESSQCPCAIDRFVEKPDRATAEHYIESGQYLWNSGMFLLDAAGVLAELKHLAPDIVAACERAVSDGRSDLDFFRLDPTAFRACPADSLDCALMEKTHQGVVIPLEAGWNDLGSWEALFQVGAKDDRKNVIKGDILVHDVKRSYLHAESRLIAAVGLEDHIVVETADAVLISPRNRVQDVKHVVEHLKATKRPEASVHKKAYRPYGATESIHNGTRFQVKRLVIRPGARISLQKHFNRAEHWIVVHGTAHVTRGEERFMLKEDESVYIPAGVVHRLENPGRIALELIEIRTGSYLGEDDIERCEDDYGRNSIDS